MAEIGAELVVVGDPKGHSTKELMRKVHAVHAAAHPKPKLAIDSRSPAPKAAKSGARPPPKGAAKPPRTGKSPVAPVPAAKRRGKAVASQAHA